MLEIPAIIIQTFNSRYYTNPLFKKVEASKPETAKTNHIVDVKV